MNDNPSTSAAGEESLPEGFTLTAGGGIIHQARFDAMARALFGGDK